MTGPCWPFTAPPPWGYLRSERQTNPLRECEVLVPPGSAPKRDPTESKELPLKMVGRPRFAAGVFGVWPRHWGHFRPDILLKS